MSQGHGDDMGPIIVMTTLFVFIQFDDDIKFIMECLRSEFNINTDEDKQMIWLMWNQKENLNRNWKKCEALLSTFTSFRDSRLTHHDQHNFDSIANKIKVCTGRSK